MLCMNAFSPLSPRELLGALSFCRAAEELGRFHEYALLPVECNLHGPQSVNTQYVNEATNWSHENRSQVYGITTEPADP